MASKVKNCLSYDCYCDYNRCQLGETIMSKLKKLRKKMNMRQIDLAKKANISITWLWALENGFDERVSKKIKERVSLALACKYEELFSR